MPAGRQKDGAKEYYGRLRSEGSSALCLCGGAVHFSNPTRIIQIGKHQECRPGSLAIDGDAMGTKFPNQNATVGHWLAVFIRQVGAARARGEPVEIQRLSGYPA